MITAIITNHNYAHYLTQCYNSCCKFCDEVLVFDDASTDTSREVLEHLKAKVVYRKTASGSSVWGCNKGITLAKGDHIIFVDADNFLISKPMPKAHYTYFPITIVDEAGNQTSTWSYPDWPLNSKDAIKKFVETGKIPIPSGGIWSAEFLKDKKWLHWPSTKMGADFCTMVDLIQYSPTIAYHPQSILAFRYHLGQHSDTDDRNTMFADARKKSQEIKQMFKHLF